MRSPRLAAVLALCAVTALTGCGGDAGPSESQFLHGAGGVNTRTDSVLLRDVSIDEPQDGVYEPGDVAILNATLLNSSTTARSLTDVSAPPAEGVRILVDPACDGDPTAVQALPLEPRPAERTPTAEAPDGPEEYYVVLLRLDTRLRAGESVPVTFAFDNGESVTVQAPVEPAREMLDIDDGLDCEARD